MGNCAGRAPGTEFGCGCFLALVVFVYERLFPYRHFAHVISAQKV